MRIDITLKHMSHSPSSMLGKEQLNSMYKNLRVVILIFRSNFKSRYKWNDYLAL